MLDSPKVAMRKTKASRDIIRLAVVVILVAFSVGGVLLGFLLSNEDEKHSNTLQRSKDDVFWLVKEENIYERIKPKVRWNRTQQSILEILKGCGKHKLYKFMDQSRFCAIERANTEQLYGEIFSYYLADFLGITNVLPTFLVPSNELYLYSTLPVVLTPYIEHLVPSYIPDEWRTVGTLSRKRAAQKSPSEIIRLMQWSDLVVFDYLIGHLDRIVNNLFNKQWNNDTMSSPAHNLYQDRNGFLYFIDNESGLFHGYRLLDRYGAYHKQLLDVLCVFRKGTVDRLRNLVSAPGALLQRQFEKFDRTFSEQLQAFPEKNARILQTRITDVLNHLEKCRKAL